MCDYVEIKNCDPFSRACVLSSNPDDLAEFERTLDEQLARNSSADYVLTPRDYEAEKRLIEKINNSCQ